MVTTLATLLAALAQQPALVTLVMGLAALGESALGLGTLLPGETLVTLGAHALQDGATRWLAWAVVAVAAFAGDHVGYLVGRRVGPALAASALVRRIGVHRWHRATQVLERYGAVTLVVGRLVPGVRTLLAPAAGALGMSYPRYACAAATAALLWSGLWVGGGAAVVRAGLAVDPAVALALVGALVLVGGLVLGTRLLAAAGHRWATWPNAVTLARLLLTVPLCAYLLASGGTSGRAPVLVLVATVLWAGSDWLDGFLARRLGQRTRVGEMLDPVADRTGVLAVCLSLAVTGHLPWWVVAVLGATDAVVAATATPAARRGDLRVSALGRLRTALLLAGLCLLLGGVLLALPVTAFGGTVVAVAAVLHMVAGADYLRRAAGAGSGLPDRSTSPT